MDDKKPSKLRHVWGKPPEREEFLNLCKKHSIAAIQRIIEIAESAADLKLKFQANQYIVDRAYGKAPQGVDLTAGGENVAQIIVNVTRKEKT